MFLFPFESSFGYCTTKFRTSLKSPREREAWLISSSSSLVNEVTATIKLQEMSKRQGLGDIPYCGTPHPMRFTWYELLLCYQFTTFPVSRFCLQKFVSCYYFSHVGILFSEVSGTFFIMLKFAARNAASICSPMTLYQPAVWCR